MLKRLFAAPFWSDARHYQIAALSTLLIYNLGWLDFGARPLNSALAIASALATQAVLHLVVQAAGVRSALAADHRAVAEPAAARGRALAACARRRHRHRLEIRLPHRRQAHLESGRLRHRGAAVHLERGVDFARRVGLDGLVRGARRLLRDPGAARRAPLRHRDLLSRRATRRSCSRAPSGSAIRSPFRSISCRAARC